VLTLVAALVPQWGQLLWARAIMGITLSGLPAVAMAYVGEEMHPKSIGLAMGLYIGGSGLGGMSGRLLVGVLTDGFGWRTAMFMMGLLGIGAGALFWIGLPASRHFQRRTLNPAAMMRAFGLHFRDAALPWLFLEAFFLMGGFVTVYNYIGYRLLAPPFNLSQTAVGFLFTVYLIGIFSSAWMGNLAGRVGRRRVFWTAFVIMLAGTMMTLSSSVWVIVAGVGTLTFGFFGGHSIASAWVGARAQQGKAQAASLYLFCYYLGSSVIGSLGGIAWSGYGWTGVITLTGTLLTVALLVAAGLSRVQPLARDLI
jgi:YNFM family putative membrane transporter